MDPMILLESGEYKNIKWEIKNYNISPDKPNAYFFINPKSFTREFLNKYSILTSITFPGFHYIEFKGKKKMYKVFDAIYNHLISLYEQGGSKYIESKEKIEKLA